MEKKYFNNLVIVNFIKSLTLSITGLIDCAITGQYIGTEGLSAMKLAMPIFTILCIFSFVFSSGLSILLSKVLMQGSKEKANHFFSCIVTMTCIIGALFTAAGIFFPPVLTDLFAGTSCTETVRVMTGEYLRPILLGGLAILFYDVIGTIVMIDGATRLLRWSSAALFAADLAGDILAVRLGMGMFGIAAASSLAYAAGLAVILLHFFKKKSLFKLGICLPDPSVLKKVILVGMPVGFTLLCNTFRPLATNHFILTYGTMPGLAALSIQDSLRYVPDALCTGIANSTLVMTGLFAAESDLHHLRRERVFIVNWSCLGGIAIAACLAIFASPLLRVFTKDATVYDLGVRALLFYLPGVPFLAINASIISYFQGLHQIRAAIAFSIFEHLLSPVMFAWILVRQYGDAGIYASFPVSECFALMILAFSLLYVRHRHKIIVPDSLLDENIIAELKMNIGNAEQAIVASHEVNSLCKLNGFDTRKSYLIALTVEELLTNSLTHGFKDHKKHHLEIRTIITDSSVTVRVRDDGRPFDLTQRYKMINPDDPSKNIGLRIIFASADEVNYNSAMNLNNVYIKMLK